MTVPSFTQIMIRPGYADDETSVRRLAALDSAPVPAPPLLLAEGDGVLRAALSTADGTAIADPFYHSAALLSLLRAHAGQQGIAPGRGSALRPRRWRRQPRPRRPRPSLAHP